MDRLSGLFGRFAPAAHVYFEGALSEIADFEGADGMGHLHLLRTGSLRIGCNGKPDQLVMQPSILFSPHSSGHRLVPEQGAEVHLMCASVDLGMGLNNPFVRLLPELMVVPLTDAPALAAQVEHLFVEADAKACGKDAVLQLLIEYILILILRHEMNASHSGSCILAGMGDGRLSRAITAIHERPAEPWTLDSLASLSNMSRARFAQKFRETVGTTPLDYLTDWRLSIACSLMRSGSSVSDVAQRVGYNNLPAFSRAFSRKTGSSPRAWVNADNGGKSLSMMKNTA